MSAPYHVLAIADWIYVDYDGDDLNPMKMNKLIYYINGWYLGAIGEPLIKQKVEAGPFGPVITEIYDEYIEFGNSAINRCSNVYYDNYDITKIDQYFISTVLETYKDYAPLKLATMVNGRGTPWHQTYDGYRTKISNITMELYFRSFLKDDEQTRKKMF